MIDAFLTYISVEKHYSPRTVESYRDDLTHFSKFLGFSPDTFRPDMAGEDDVRTWLLHMMEQEHAAPRTVRRRLSALHSYYRFLLRTGAVKRDITRLVTAPKVDKPLPVFFKESEMERETETEQLADPDDFDAQRDNLIIQLLYQTGMRQAEMLGLTVGDIDFQQRQVRIFGKRRKERIVPLGDGVLAQLREYLDAREQLTADSSLESLFVYQNRRGAVVPLTKDFLYKVVRGRMGEVSSLAKHSPHVLRHTFATTMLDHGADIRTIQTLMGHVSLATTQIYTHTTFEQLRTAYQHAHPRANKSINNS